MKKNRYYDDQREWYHVPFITIVFKQLCEDSVGWICVLQPAIDPYEDMYNAAPSPKWEMSIKDSHECLTLLSSIFLVI